MNQENEHVASDLRKTSIVFNFKETPAVKCTKKACPVCKSTDIYHKKSKAIKRPGGGPRQYIPSGYHCHKCKTPFTQPIYVESTKGKVSMLPDFLKCKVKEAPPILSP